MIKCKVLQLQKSCFRIGAVHAYTNQLTTFFEQMQTRHRKDAKNNANNDRTNINTLYNTCFGNIWKLFLELRHKFRFLLIFQNHLHEHFLDQRVFFAT